MENNKGNQIPSTTMISSTSLSTQQSTTLPTPSQQIQSELVPTTTTTVTNNLLHSNATALESKQIETQCDNSNDVEKKLSTSAFETDSSSVEKLTCDISNISLNKNKTEMDKCKCVEGNLSTTTAAARTAITTATSVSRLPSAMTSTSSMAGVTSNNRNLLDNNSKDITLNICSNCINCTKCDKNKNSAIRDRRIHSETASTIKPATATIVKSSTIDRISPTLPTNRIVKPIKQATNAVPSSVQTSNVPIFVDRYPVSAHPTYLPAHFRNIPKTQSLDLGDDRSDADILPSLYPKGQSFDQTRPIYPNVPYSPYGSPFGSPRSGRRRVPITSRRISIEQSGSFLQLNQYKLMDQIGQVQ